MKRVIQAATFFATAFMATSAFAATAIVTTGLHLRTGPGSSYAVETSMPEGAIVSVPGCARGYDWCRVDWNGYRGWASANYLAFNTGRYRHRPFALYGATIGVPVVTGVVIHDYHHRRHHRVRKLRHQRRHLRHELHRARRHHHRHHRRHVAKKYCRHHPRARVCR